MRKNRISLLLTLLLCCFATAWAVQKVTVAPTQNGTVAVSPATPTAGATVTLTVTPNSGYKISKADVEAMLTIDPGQAQVPGLKAEGPQVGQKLELQGDDPADLSAPREYTFTMPEEPYDVLVTANFTSIPLFNITVNASENGQVTADKTQAAENETVTLTVAPAEGYELDVLTVDGQAVEVEGTTYSFAMPAHDVTVSATFKKVEAMYLIGSFNGWSQETKEPMTKNAQGKWEITKALDENVTFKFIDENGNFYGGQANAGTNFLVTYEMLGVEISMNLNATENNFEMPVAGTWKITADRENMKAVITGEWLFNVAVAEGIQNGTVFADPTSAAEGATINLTVAPAEGYELQELYYMKGNDKVEITGTSFVMPASDVTVYATFQLKQYTITVAEGIQNGTVTAPATATAGEEVTLNITPAEGYELDAVTVTCETLNLAVTVTDGKFTMPADNVTVNATFKKKSYTITVAEGIQNGTVTAPATATAGEEVTLAITPAEGYELDAVTVTCETLNLAVTVTDGKFTMPADNVVVSATFKAIPATTYTITITEPQNGTVTADKTEAAEGETVTLTITPAEGYELETLTVMMGETAVEVTADNTFTMPAGNVVVSATFKAVIHTYSVTGQPAELFGAENDWDPNNTNGDMTLGADGNYTWTSEPTYLEGDETIEFKVVTDHSWSNPSYPSGPNMSIEGLKPGTYTVTVTFNPETGEITYNVEGQADVYVWGTFGENVVANEGLKMTSEDGKIYTAAITIPNFSVGYGFFALTHKLGADAQDWTTLGKYRFMAESEETTDFLVTGPMMNKELGLVYKSDASMKIPAGEYTLTLDLENMKLTIAGGTQLSYILENGVVGVDYTVINDLAVVDNHDGTAQYFTSDGNDNWITIKGGSLYAAALESMKGGFVSGVFSDKNQNPYLTLTTAPVAAAEAMEVEPKPYMLADAFSPKVDEVVIVKEAYYQARDNALRAYSPGSHQGQSLTVDNSLFDYSFIDGHRYTVRGVANIKEPWSTEQSSGAAPKDYDYPFQNYKLLVLEVEDHGIPTSIDDLNAEQGVKSVRYYNVAGMESTTPFNGMNIIVKEMNDGSKVTTKAVVK